MAWFAKDDPIVRAELPADWHAVLAGHVPEPFRYLGCQEVPMPDDTMTIPSVCGWEATGTEADVVPATIEHGRRLRNAEATPEQVLAMAVGHQVEPPVPAEADVP